MPVNPNMLKELIGAGYARGEVLDCIYDLGEVC